MANRVSRDRGPLDRRRVQRVGGGVGDCGRGLGEGLDTRRGSEGLMAKRKRKGRERAELLCMLVAELPIPSPDALIRHCYGCREKVWVSMGALEMFGRDHDLNFICQPCAAARPKDQVTMAVDPRQLDDMRAMGLSDVEIVCTLAMIKCATLWGVTREDAVMRLEKEFEANGAPAEEFQSAVSEYMLMFAQWDARN